MFPIIFSVGLFSLRTVSILAVVAILVASFVFYRKVREEHFSEEEAFDGFLLSMLLGFLAGRLGFIAANFGSFGWNVWQWFDVISRPGFVGSAGVVAAGWYLFAFSKKFVDDRFQLMDLWSIAITTGLGIMWIGLFLDGASAGLPTSLPVGMTFPGMLEPHLPIQLFSAAFFFILAWFLQWFEYRYRTFSWYRSGKTSAQSGFLISVTIISVSLWYLILSWVRAPQFVVYGLPIEAGVAVLGLLYGIGLLFIRSGRTFWIWK